MSVSPISERQIVTVIRHFNSVIPATFGRLSCEEENDIARKIAIANEGAYDERYYSNNTESYRLKQSWKKHSFPFHLREIVSHTQCLRYLNVIIYNCDSSSNWEKSDIKRILERWHSHLLQEIFSGIWHLAPQASDLNYQLYQEHWLKALAEAATWSHEYTDAKAYLN